MKQALIAVALAAVVASDGFTQHGSATPEPTRADAPARVDLSLCTPVYPVESIKAEETGRTRVRFSVSSTGKLLGLKLVSSSGHERLDQAVLSVLTNCRHYTPATRNGQSVDAASEVEYVWELSGNPETVAGQGPIAGPCKGPAYPTESVVAEEEGTGRFKFFFNEHGDVVRSEVLRSSGYSRLDNAVLSAFALCKFRPAVSKEGQPVAGDTIIEYAWRLR